MFERLRELRREKNIKAKEMAEKMGLKTEGAYYKKETGTVPFTLEESKIVADILNMPMEEIFFANEISCRDKTRKEGNK